MKYKHIPYKYSQIKSYYESPLSVVIQESPYKIIATLNIKKQEVRLNKCKPRGAEIKLGRPPRKHLFVNTEPVETETEAE